MEIEKLIEILRGKCAVCKRSSCNGKYWVLSSCPATCEAADALEQLQAENDRLRRERDAAVECCSGYCTSCNFEDDCAKHDMNDAAPTRWYYGDCEDWEWQGVKEE